MQVIKIILRAHVTIDPDVINPVCGHLIINAFQIITGGGCGKEGVGRIAQLQFKIPGKAAAIRRAHRLCGRILNVLAPLAIGMGLRLADKVPRLSAVDFNVAASDGTMLISGARKIASRNAAPVTTDARPVRAPSPTPAVDSM